MIRHLSEEDVGRLAALRHGDRITFLNGIIRFGSFVGRRGRAFVVQEGSTGTRRNIGAAKILAINGVHFGPDSPSVPLGPKG